MESGSIEEVTERLRSWCIHHAQGLARVEWDSVYARQEVVDRLHRSLGSSGISLVELGLPPNEAAEEIVSGLIEKLQSVSGSVVSITGIEWAFPETGTKLDTLVGLSFQRETLASLPVRQIWWVPSTLTERFVLGVPDLDSWFRLRLHLTEVPPRPADTPREVPGTERKTVSVAEARLIARRFWDRLDAARAQNIPEERIWAELAQPAVDALLSAGLELEARDISVRMPDARELLERKLEDLGSTRGPEDPEVLSLNQRLARLLIDRGDLSGARRLQEGVLNVITRVLGDEHPATLKSMSDLASTLRAQGDYVGARQFQERGLEVRTRVLGEEHTDTLTAMNNLALTLWAQGDLAGARRLQERVLEVRTRVLGEENPNTLASMNNLAVLQYQAGDRDEAIRLLRKCLLGRRKILGENHHDTLATAQLLSRLETQPQASLPSG